MRNSIIAIFLCLCWFAGKAQDETAEHILSELINLNEVGENNQNFEGYEHLKSILKDAEIVALGEQTHYDGNTTDTKVKLIQYLHREMGFDILVYESGFYDCNKAWTQIRDGRDVGVVLGKTIPNGWAVSSQVAPLINYIATHSGSEHPLQVMGMDYQFSPITAAENYIADLRNELQKTDSTWLQTREWQHLETTLKLSLQYDTKTLKKREIDRDTTYINSLISLFQGNRGNEFWVQVLKNNKAYLADQAFGVYTRDQKMAENLIWIKEQYPDKKIICWGATSHFLYQSEQTKFKNLVVRLITGGYFKKYPSMGNYLKEKYGDRFYTIGFTTFGGEFGFGSKGEIKPARKGSIEYVLNQSTFDNALLPLNRPYAKYFSRPLGHKYIKNDISEVMDAVIFNRKMTALELNRDLYIQVYPESKLAKQ